MGKSGRVALGVLALASATACSGTQDISLPSSIPVTTPLVVRDADRRLLEQYVAAAEARDVAGMMALRCPEARIGDDQSALFAQQLGRVLDQTGGIELGEITPSSSGPVPAQQGAEPANLAYALVVGGKPAPARMETVVATVDGKRLLCGTGVEGAAARSDQAALQLVDTGPPGRTAKDLIPAAVAGPYTLDGDAAGPGDAADGLVDSAKRSWKRADFGGVTITARHYDSPDSAQRAADEFITRVAPDSDRTLAVDVDGAIAFHTLAASWTWVQPPGAGDDIVQVLQLDGDTLVVTQVAAAPGDPATERLAFDLARQSATLAHG